MKRMKKILALGLAAVLTLGMSLTVWADDVPAAGGGPAKAPTYNEDGKIGTRDDGAVITIKGVTEEAENADLKVTAYPIIQAAYDSNGIYNGYRIVSDYKEVFQGSTYTDFEIADDGRLNYKNFTEAKEFPIGEDTLNGIIKKLGGTSGETMVKDEGSVTVDGTCSYSKELPIGSYLIMITGAEAKIYSAVVASSYYTTGTGNSSNTVAGSTGDGGLDISTFRVATADAWVKVSDSPNLDKKVAAEEGQDDSDQTNHNSVNIGDTVKYEIEVDPIPYYGGDTPIFNIVDTLTGGLAYESTPEVKIVGTDGETEILSPKTIDNQMIYENESGNRLAKFDWQNSDSAPVSSKEAAKKFKIDFVEVTGEGENETSTYFLNDYQGSKLVITYKAKVTEEAAVNHNTNSNKAELNYSKDSKVNSDDSEGNKEKETYTYTFAIGGTVNGEETGDPTGTGGVIVKVGEEETEDPETGETIKAPLQGAVFTLYTEAAQNADGTYTVVETSKYTNHDKDGNELFKGTATSDRNGHLEMRGLAAGTYYLKETEAPAGYSVNEHVFKVVIDAKYYGDNGFVADEESDNKKTGMLARWSITIDGKLTGTFSIVNEKGGYTENGEDSEGNKNEIKPVEIQNTKLINLPSTGGIGTTVFTVAGVLLMAGAVFLFFVNRRKTQNGQEK